MADAAGPSRADWIALVRRSLGEDADLSVLSRQTADGLTIEALYGPDNAPEPASFLLRLRDADRPWDVRTLIRHPDRARCNAEVLSDLEGGAASAIIRVDPTGEAGVAVGSAEELARVLDGVVLELAPIGLDARFLGPQAADWLAAAAKGSPAARLMFHLDPLGAFAVAGHSPGPIEAHLIAAANTGARLSAAYPAASLFLASGKVVHEADGGPAAELGFAAACALAYAKALVRAGLAIEDAFARITLGLAVDSRALQGVAKLRAARLIWGRMIEACGVTAASARIETRSSRRMLADRDMWTNMLRLTLAGFAGATGGADTVVLGAFTDPLGLPTEFARRQSRNIQLVLMEEAGVGAVADPARGAWAIEAMTDQLARAGWAAFQAIEAAGGIVRALESGQARTMIAANAEPPVVGVTAFPNPDDKPPEIEIAEAAASTAAPSARLPGPDSVCPALAP